MTTHHRVRVLLIDDQIIIGEAVRRMLATERDIDFLFCSDPTRAVQTANEFRPTVILQDLVMPEINGLTLLRFFRANAATREVPMIVLSVKEEANVKAEAFALGANDYLVKLPDPIELIARVRHHSRGYIAQLERNEAYAALQQSEQRLAQELSQAGKYVASLLPERLSGDITTDWRFVPSTQLGGDAFGYHWIDADHFAMYLLDVCGHGVKSALLAISAMNVMRNQTLPSTDFRDPTQVLAAMNDAFQMDRHDGLYFTMWYGVYEARSRQLTFASAGHPPAVLLSGRDDDVVAEKLLNPGMVIGMLPTLDVKCAVREIKPSSRLYLFSDGIYEVTRPDETMLSFDDFVELLSQPIASDLSRIDYAIACIRAISGQTDFEDDVSLVEIMF